MGVHSASGVEASGAAVTAFMAFFTAIYLPFSKKSRNRRRENHLLRLWFVGAEGVEGISPTLVAAPVQLANLQRDMETVLERVDEILRRVS